MPFVYSTLTNDNVYNDYTTDGEGNKFHPRLIKSILIKGGANRADKKLVTPFGVVTNVSDEDLAILEKNEVFQTHVKNGYIKVQKSKADPEVVAADMQGRDESAPLVDADLVDNANEDETKAKIVVDKKKIGTVKNNIK